MTCTRSALAFGLAALLVIPFASFAQQTNQVERLKVQYETQRQKIDAEALVAYSNVLVTVGNQLKQKADIAGYSILKSEQRFIAEKQVLPEGPDRTNLVGKLPGLDAPLSKIEASRNAKIANLLKQYILALEAQIRQYMTAEKLDEAKTAGEVKSSAESALADVESKLPKMTGAPKPSQPITPPARDPIPKGAKVFKGHHYLFIAEKKAWYKAKKACEEMGGHLVTIANKQENNFAFKLTDGENAWIGCTDIEEEGHWKWVTGEPVSYSNWADGQPDNYQGDPFGMFWANTPSRWCDNNDSFLGPVPFICEWDY